MLSYEFKLSSTARYGISPLPGYKTRLHVINNYYTIYDANLNPVRETLGVVSHAKNHECLREFLVFNYENSYCHKSHHVLNPDVFKSVVESSIGSDDSEHNIFRNDEIVEIDGHLYIKSTHEVGNPNTIVNLNASLIGNIVFNFNRVSNMLIWDLNPEIIDSMDSAASAFSTIHDMKSAKYSLNHYVGLKKMIIDDIAKNKATKLGLQNKLDFILETEADALNELQEKFGIEL